jgi:group I intron endonuclease
VIKDDLYEIYVVENLINGKKYVGSHKIREAKDYYFAGGKAINNAIKKYGKDNFSRKILEKCISEKVLLIESSWIKKLDSLHPNGYNIHPMGGSNYKGSIGLIHNKEIRDKISKAKKSQYKNGIMNVNGENNPMFGKKHSNESIQKIKINHHDVSRENNPMFGVKPLKKICPHCNKSIDIRNYSRWHGDKCKNK